MITLTTCLLFGSALFTISLIGILLNKKNLLSLLMSIELMLLGVNTNLISVARFVGSTGGEVFVFFILTVAAAEAAIGLAILVMIFRNRKTVQLDQLNTLKG
jgi:NADH-quinone oxidoreductase subunit K